MDRCLNRPSGEKKYQTFHETRIRIDQNTKKPRRGAFIIEKMKEKFPLKDKKVIYLKRLPWRDKRRVIL